MVSKRYFQLIKVVLAVVGVGFMVWIVAVQHVIAGRRQVAEVLARDGVRELEALARDYGNSSTRYAEEWAVRDFFHDQRDGVFVDVGANDYKNENNTYFLEASLGWSGVAVDAQQEFAAGYATHRPRTKFVAAFISDVSRISVPFYVPKANTLTASADRTFAESEDGAAVEREVPTLTLDDLLTQQHLAHVDFVSIDVELAEPKALAGFSVDRYRPSLVCIEAHSAVRQQILDYFQRHAYVVVGKYLRLDTANLWFTPASR